MHVCVVAAATAGEITQLHQERERLLARWGRGRRWQTVFHRRWRWRHRLHRRWQQRFLPAPLHRCCRRRWGLSQSLSARRVLGGILSFQHSRQCRVRLCLPPPLRQCKRLTRLLVPRLLLRRCLLLCRRLLIFLLLRLLLRLTLTF